MALQQLRQTILRDYPLVWLLYRSMRYAKNEHNEEVKCIRNFLFSKSAQAPFGERLKIVNRLFYISKKIESLHYQNDVLPFIKAAIELPASVEGCIVEAGCYKGGSTAKFSIAAKKTNRKLHVFDSFEGLPKLDSEDDRAYNTITGKSIDFTSGEYAGRIDEVKSNVRSYGEYEMCEFVKGWFEDTLPHFNKKIAAIYLDVDLVSSTKVCLKYFYPLLSPGGVIFSHDGDLAEVAAVYDDDRFWREELGCEKPHVHGLGKQKIISLYKPLGN